MNAALLKGVVTLSIAVVLVCVWVIVLRRRRTLGSRLQLIGIPCLVVLALAHVFEAFDLLSFMGWGQPRSIGHYLDLVAAAVGVSTVLPGVLLQRTPLSTR